MLLIAFVGLSGLVIGATFLSFRLYPLLLAALVLWTFLEWIFPKLIPWSLGSALVGSAVLQQSANLFRVHGLSFVIAEANAGLAQTLLPSTGTVPRRLMTLAPALMSTLALSLYGMVRLRRQDRAPTGESLTVAAVQGCVGSGDLDITAENGNAWKTYFDFDRSFVPAPGRWSNGARAFSGPHRPAGDSVTGLFATRRALWPSCAPPGRAHAAAGCPWFAG